MIKGKIAMLMEPGRFEIQEIEVNCGPDDLLIKVEACGLCNWELNHWKGILGPYPQEIGHEQAGYVMEVGSNVEGFEVGDLVTCLGGIGFAEYDALPASCCMKVNKDIDPRHAFSEPLKCIVTVLTAAAPEPADVGVVFGCGPMGQWCIQALQGKFLSALIAVDISDEKLEMAKKFGATHTINSRKVDAREEIARITDGHMADFLIEGTGLTSVMDTAMTYLRNQRGRFIVMSSYEEVFKEVDMRPAMSRGVSIIFAHPKHAVNGQEDWRRAVVLINNGTFNIKDLISHEFKFENITEAFETLEHKPADFIKGVVVMHK